MLYRVTGSIFFILYGVNAVLSTRINPVVLGVVALIAGIALAVGV